MKTQKIIKPSNDNIRVANAVLVEMREALPQILKQPFFYKRVPMEEKILFLKELAAAKSNFWRTVYETYPETKNVSCTASDLTVEWEETEPDEPINREE